MNNFSPASTQARYKKYRYDRPYLSGLGSVPPPTHFENSLYSLMILSLFMYYIRTENATPYIFTKITYMHIA